MNIELTENNHFCYYYNEKSFSLRSHRDDKLSTSHGTVTRPRMSWRDECLFSAKRIVEKYGDKVSLLFSGGLDSEVMLRSFVANGSLPNVVIVRFANYLNHHDLNYATQVCEQLQITPNFLDIDIEKFWQEEVFKYTDPIQLTSPQIAVILWAIEQIDGVACVGAGENFLQREYGKETFYDVESEVSLGFYRWFIHKNKPGIPAFFQYTPEQMYSFLEDEVVNDMLKNAKSKKFMSTSKVKYDLYKKHFDLKPRASMTGFELLMDHDKNIRQQLEDRYLGASSLFKTELNIYKKSFEGSAHD